MIKLLKSPGMMLAGILAGILIGLKIRSVVPYIRPFGHLYLSLLQMCVLPMAACSVCISTGQLVSGGGRKIAVRFLAATAAILLTAAVIGTAGGFLLREYLRPGTAEKLALVRMSAAEAGVFPEPFRRLEFYQEQILPAAAGAEVYPGIAVLDALAQSVPENIFKALTAGQMVQVLIFFALLGMMLRNVKETKRETFFELLEGIYDAICALVNRMLLFLPAAMCILLAELYATDAFTDMEEPLFRLCAAITAVLLGFIGLMAVLIQCVCGCTIKQHWRAVKRMIFITLGTRNRFASIPVVLEDCSRELRMDQKTAHALLPVSITVCQGGVIVCGAVAAVFAAAVYEVPVNWMTIFMIAGGAVFYSYSVIGVSGVAAAELLGAVLLPLGIPVSPVILIYLTAMPVFEPLSVFAGVYANYAVVCLAAGKRKNVIE